MYDKYKVCVCVCVNRETSPFVAEKLLIKVSSKFDKNGSKLNSHRKCCEFIQLVDTMKSIPRPRALRSYFMCI